MDRFGEVVNESISNGGQGLRVDLRRQLPVLEDVQNHYPLSTKKTSNCQGVHCRPWSRRNEFSNVMSAPGPRIQPQSAANAANSIDA